jgi:hypothetical protein
VTRVSRWWFGLLPLLVFLTVLHTEPLFAGGFDGTDFSWTLWEPARAVLDGGDPYVHSPTNYPPSAFVPLLPLGALPFAAAEAVWLTILAVAAFATLWVLGVRDWRCFALWTLTPLTFPTVFVGNATVLVVLCAALLWRYRDAAVPAAAALTAAIAIKLFAAPLILWMLFTRRYRAAAYTTVATPIVILGAWATIGFDGLRSYRSILEKTADDNGPYGPLLQGLVQQMGGSSRAAFVAGLAVAAALVASALRARGDASRFALVWAAAIVASPVAWLCYVAGLVVPLAAASPRFSPRWLLLLGCWSGWWWSPLAFGGAGLSIATLLVTALLVAAVAFPSSLRRRARGRGALAPATAAATERPAY